MFESLPVELLCTVARDLGAVPDLLSLLAVSKTMRHKLLRSVDVLVRHLTPHYLLPPFADEYFDIEEDEEDEDSSMRTRSSTPESRCASVLFSDEDGASSTATTPLESVGPSPLHHFPWLCYARECALNVRVRASMRNRRRIFWICSQIAALAHELTDADMDGRAAYPDPS